MALELPQKFKVRREPCHICGLTASKSKAHHSPVPMHKDTPEEGIHHPLNVLLMFLELEDGEVEVNFICTPIAKTTEIQKDNFHLLPIYHKIQHKPLVSYVLSKLIILQKS